MRWTGGGLIHRPLICRRRGATIDSLDLSSATARLYDVRCRQSQRRDVSLDDFGRQRVEARQLLNRWVFPLEHGYDYLTLRTGQKINIPFRQLLIVCTNLDPHAVMDPAFLRRMGYRLYLDNPSEEMYAEIFARYAADCGVEVPPGLVARLVARYEAEGRPLRSCEPRDL